MNITDFVYLGEELDKSNLSGSDCSLANLFLLQQKYNTLLYINENILFRYYFGDENRTGWGFPLPLKSAGADYLKNALKYIIEQSASQKLKLAFCLCSQEQKNLLNNCLEQHFPGKTINWKTNQDDCDYLYLTQNLANLPGMNYQKKRNHVSRFNRLHPQWEYKSFPQNDIAQDILKVSQIWFEENDGNNNHTLILEQESIKAALEYSQELDMHGGVLYVNSQPVAFTLSSPISDSVLDVIYEKAVAEYAKDGAYAVINNQFAKKAVKFLYLNREEDMGVPGLRKAKLSYKPTLLLDKFYGSLE